MFMNQKKSILFCLIGIVVFFTAINVSGQNQPDLARIFADAKDRKGKRPIIIVPGIVGSELINKETDEKVWFSVGRSKDDDLKLPIAFDLKASRDNLRPGDIVRKLNLPVVRDLDVYQKIIDALENYGGYVEASWDKPPKKLDDTFFVFPYDWRRDNVETARILLEKIEKIKAKTKQPKMKFNVLAHSMGGLVTRYAAMYGKRDLPKGKPKPTWTGGRHFNKVFLFGTPNEGSADAFQTLLEGFGAIRNVNLPFVRDLNSIEVFTMPSLFQLMPHKGTERFFDENLEGLKLNIYDYKTWERYGWSIYGKQDELFKNYSEAEVGRLEAYLEVVLKRAKKFHEALNVRKSNRSLVSFVLVGSDCQRTLDGFVVYKDVKKDKWVTLTQPKSFRKSTGEKVQSKTLQRLMLKPGDGRVTRRSLLADTISQTKQQSVLFDSETPLTNALFACEKHDSLMANPTIQNNILTVLVNEANQ